MLCGKDISMIQINENQYEIRSIPFDSYAALVIVQKIIDEKKNQTTVNIFDFNLKGEWEREIKRLLKPEEIEKTMTGLGNLYTHDLKFEDI